MSIAAKVKFVAERDGNLSGYTLYVLLFEADSNNLNGASLVAMTSTDASAITTDNGGEEITLEFDSPYELWSKHYFVAFSEISAGFGNLLGIWGQGNDNRYWESAGYSGLSGTADSGSATTLVDNPLSQFSDNYFVGSTLTITGGTGEGETATITESSGSTLTFADGLSGGSEVDETSKYTVDANFPSSWELCDEENELIGDCAQVLDADSNVLFGVDSFDNLDDEFSVTGKYRASIGYEAEADAPDKASNPVPENEDTSVKPNIPLYLTWEDPGAGTAHQSTSYDLYFGTDFGGADYLAAADIPAGYEYWEVPENIHQLMGNIGINYLNALQGYEWYIVSKNDAGETKGDTWTFTTVANSLLGKATTPTPETEAIDQNPGISLLTWEGCEGSATNKIYMGTTSGSLSFYRSVDGATLSVNPSSFHPAFGGTVYWRVDTSNSFAGTTGDEWSFSTFSLFGSPPASATGALPTIRLLCAIANNKFWYEDLT
jgi:hypothetical protein